MKLLYSNDQPGVHAPSWYRTRADLPEFPTAVGHIDTDTCVIGGGYTGLAAARELAEAGHTVVVLEAHRVGWGASGRNGGQLGTGYNRSQPELETQLGTARAHQLWQLAEEGKVMAHEIASLSGTALGIRPGVINALHRRRFVKPAQRAADHLRQHYDYPHLEVLDRTAMRSLVASDDYHGGVLDHGAGHLDPLALAVGLARAAHAAGATILEHSEALAIDSDAQHRVKTEQGEVRARSVIVACNGYLDTLLPAMAGLIMPINNFIIVTEPLGARAATLLPGHHAVADSRFVVNYFRRTDDDRLLFGGGESYGYRFPADLQHRVRRAMLGIFPQLAEARIDHAWGGTLAISRSRFPVVRRFGEHVLAGAGYSGHGVGLALITGRVMAESILGKSERLSWLEQVPARRFPGGVRARPMLLAGAMSISGWLDRL